jgi:hypothetical protein
MIYSMNHLLEINRFYQWQPIKVKGGPMEDTTSTAQVRLKTIF